MLARLPDELTEDLACIRIDGDAVGFVDHNDQASMIPTESRKHCGDGDGPSAHAKRRRTIKYLSSITLSKTPETCRDDPASILLASRQGVLR